MNGKSVVTDFISRIDAALRGLFSDPYELLSDDVVLVVIGTTPLSGTYFGHDEIQKILIPTAALRIKSGEISILDLISESDKIGAFLKIKAISRSGKIYNAAEDPAGCYFKLSHGKICEIRIYPDTTQIETQIYGRAFVSNKKSAHQGREINP